MASSYYKLDVLNRTELRSKSVRALRKKGFIPGVLYYAGEENVNISIEKSVLFHAMQSGQRIFEVDQEGDSQYTMIKQLQYHPVTEEVIHIDLYGVRMDQAVNIKVVIELMGDAKGVKDDGGILNQPLNELEIQCLPGDIPDLLELDISELAMGNSLNAGDIKLDDKFTLVTPEDSVVVSVTQPMKEVEPVVELDEDEAFMDEEGEGEEVSGDEKESDGAGGDEKAPEKQSDSE